MINKCQPGCCAELPETGEFLDPLPFLSSLSPLPAAIPHGEQKGPEETRMNTLLIHIALHSSACPVTELLSPKRGPHAGHRALGHTPDRAGHSFLQQLLSLPLPRGPLHPAQGPPRE